jgi:arylsulfatase
VHLGDWKLIAAHNEPWQLYNLATDRSELHDVASKNPEKVAELKQLYEQWAKRCGVEPWPVKRG